MASTFTSRIRLNKQGDGDNPNSWGVVLNDGVISLVDDAIAAYTTISIGSAATVTLSLSGFVGSETVTSTNSSTFSDKNVATGKTVTVNSITLVDGSNGGLAAN